MTQVPGWERQNTDSLSDRREVWRLRLDSLSSTRQFPKSHWGSANPLMECAPRNHRDRSQKNWDPQLLLLQAAAVGASNAEECGALHLLSLLLAVEAGAIRMLLGRAKRKA